MNVLYSYKNGETTVTIHDDGTKIRDVSNGTRADYPESIDVKVTNYCDAQCLWCHEKSTIRGKHADLTPTIDLLTQLPAGAEIAIGGGHPLAHPDFDLFVKVLSEHGIICNVTINEHHFEKELPRIERLVADGHVRGVGYSYSTKTCTWKYDHLVTHVITGTTNYSRLEDIVQVNPKVLLLGYKKNTGRGSIFYKKQMQEVDKNIQSWYAGLFYAVRKAHISFDNLAIEQLNPRRLFTDPTDYDRFYMGTDGSYSMYIDAVNQQYSVSSTGVERVEYGSSLKDMFAIAGGLK